MRRLVVGMVLFLAIASGCDPMVSPEPKCEPTTYEPAYGAAIPEVCPDTTLAPAGD